MKYYDKSLGPVISFIIWLVLLAIVCIIGINNVFAASYTGFDYSAQLYDNLGPTLNSVTTSGPTAGTGAYEGYIGYTANSSGGAWGVSSPITLISNHTYTLTASIPNECGNIILSSYNRIGVGTTLNNAKTSYQNNTNVNEVYSKAIAGNNFLIQFAFTPTINGSYIVFPYATSVSCSSSRTILENITIDDLGSEGVSINDINSSLSSQTNELNNSINNSTNIITGEINDMEQSIVDSNNQTQDVIKDQFNDCKIYDKTFNTSDININDNFLNSDGVIEQSGGWGIIEYIEINENINYTLKLNRVFGNSPAFCLYDKNKNLINCTKYSNGTEFNFNSNNAKYLSMSFILVQGTTANLKSNEEICSNRIDETNDKLNNIDGTLNNTDSSGATNDASNFFSNFTTDTFGLTSIITAPLSLINSITSSSCSTLRLPLPYLDNEYLELPCMNTIYIEYFGSFFNIYQTITFGIVAYWVIVRIFNQVKDFKNPDHDEIEVLDL